MPLEYQQMPTIFCPNCDAVVAENASECEGASCSITLSWIPKEGAFRDALLACDTDSISVPLSVSRVPPDKKNYDLRKSRESFIGRNPGVNGFVLPHSAVNEIHCVVYRSDIDAIQYWIATSDGRSSIAINGVAKRAAKLEDGDLIQIGPFGILFNEKEQLLVPANAIEPIAVEIANLQIDVADRQLSESAVDRGNGKKRILDVESLSLDKPTGEFIGVIGASGSGKSTLLKAIAGLNRNRTTGVITVGGEDIGKPNVVQDHVGYVPQDLTVHEHLTPKEVLKFTALLRGGESRHGQEFLRQLQVLEEHWVTPIIRLSGGQRKRVCTAVELSANQRLLLLDEPGSGLDPDSEQSLMKLLRNLSLCGCTVIIVAHNLRLVREFCTRLIVVKRGQVGFNGPPKQFEYYDNLSDFPVSEESDLDANAEDVVPVDFGSNIGRKPRGRSRQCKTLLKREFRLLLHDGFNRIVFPVLVLPLLFAVALGVSVGQDSLGLLWFFSVLAMVWMGASVGLLSIVGERTVFNHERHLYLRIWPYVTSKMLALCLIGLFQSVVFLVLLLAVRWLMGLYSVRQAESLNYWWDLVPLLAVLVVTNLGGIASGVLMSALANKSRHAANLMLPLFMIAQIVFSVAICMEAGDDNFKQSYEKFQLHHCQSDPSCERRAEHWRSDVARWLCDRCKRKTSEIIRAGKSPSDESDGIDQKHVLGQLAKAVSHQIRESEDLENAAREAADHALPNRLAVTMSYLTLSRYGDTAARSVHAYSVRQSKDNVELNDELSRWRNEALFVILAYVISCVCIAMAVLWCQGNSRLASRG